MKHYTNGVPVMPENKNIPYFTRKGFVKTIGLSYLYVATVPNSLTKCELKKHYFKIMPGFPFVGLVTVASYLPRLRRAVLFLLLSHSLKLATNAY